MVVKSARRGLTRVQNLNTDLLREPNHHERKLKLSTRRERPRRCAVGQRDEGASFHCRWLPCFRQDSTPPHGRRLLRCEILIQLMSLVGHSRRFGVGCESACLPIPDIPGGFSSSSHIGRYGILDRVSASVCFDVGGPDHLGPLFGFVGDQRSKVGGRARKRCAAHIGRPKPGSDGSLRSACRRRLPTS